MGRSISLDSVRIKANLAPSRDHYASLEAPDAEDWRPSSTATTRDALTILAHIIADAFRADRLGGQGGARASHTLNGGIGAPQATQERPMGASAKSPRGRGRPPVEVRCYSGPFTNATSSTDSVAASAHPRSASLSSRRSPRRT